jgi:hypothetical protein
MFFWVVTPRRVDSLVDTNVSEEHTACIFSPEDGGCMSIRNVAIYLRVHTVLQPTGPTSALNQFLYTIQQLYY